MLPSFVDDSAQLTALKKINTAKTIVKYLLTQVKEEIYTYLISDELVESYYKTISDIDAGGDTWADYSTEYDAYYGGEISADVARLIVDTYMEELRSADMSIFTENKVIGKR